MAHMEGFDRIETTEARSTGADPAMLFGRERRLHARAYDYWVSLLRGRRMPAIADMEPGQLDAFAGQSVLIELDAVSAEPAIAFLGRELRDEAEIAPARPTLTDIPSGTMLAELLRRFPDIVAYRAPVGFEAEFTGRGGVPLLHRGILLPFADEQGRLSAVYGVVSWKAVAAVDAAPDIAAAVASAFNSRPVRPVTSIWGDGPGAAVKDQPKPVETPPLDRRLAAARTWAALAETDRTRSSASLHAALGAAYDLALEARRNPAVFAASAGVPATTRAIVTTVFGGPLSRLGRVELRRYALVLDYGMRLGLGTGQLPAWLDAQVGGHRAAANQERRARLIAERGLRQAADEAWGAGQPAVGHLTLSPVDADFLLLLGRRAPRGVDVIAPVPADEGLTRAAFARVRAA
jgi:hypothetical protein